MLDIEIAGAVRELREEEKAVGQVPTLKRLRDSHHAVAKLLASGMTPMQVSLQTGYAPSRISTLQNDPAFKELLIFYAKERDVVAQEVETLFLGVARDAMQAVHERILDEGQEIPVGELREIFKTFADRAGYAPITRSINKNLNVNIGERLDAARKRKDAA